MVRALSTSRGLLRENAYRQIKRRILDGTLRPGQFLTEDEMANALSVSRTPVREALAALSRDGLLELVPHRGAFVRRPSLKDVEDLFEIRIALETLALRKALPQLSEEVLQSLLARTKRQQATLAKLGPKDVEALSVDIHMVLLKVAGNEHIVELIHQLRERVYIGSTLYQNSDGSLNRAHAERMTTEHHELLLALLKKDAKAATRLLEEHLLGSKEMVVAALRES
jgi:DNA-binding GntR family transcriptional regulator